MTFITRGQRAAVISLTTVVALTSAAPYAAAQKYLGSIQGEISDPTGAKVPGVTITAEDVATHFKTTVTSSGDGAFVLGNLNPATYTVSASAPNFKAESRTGIVITAGELQVINIALTAGGGAETVEVSSDSNSLIDTGSANIATTLNQQEVTDLPNVGRNPFVLATLAAGISTNEYFQVKASQFTNPYSGVAVQISSLGNGGHNRLTLNGVPDDPADFNTLAHIVPAVFPPVFNSNLRYRGGFNGCHRRVFKVLTGLYSAEYGRNDGGQIVVTTHGWAIRRHVQLLVVVVKSIKREVVRRLGRPGNVTAVQWQLIQFLLIDHRADRVALRLDLIGVGRHCHHLTRRSRDEREVYLRMLVDHDRQPGTLIALKARRRNIDAVMTKGKRREVIVPICGQNRLEDSLCIYIGLLFRAISETPFLVPSQPAGERERRWNRS